MEMLCCYWWMKRFGLGDVNGKAWKAMDIAWQRGIATKICSLKVLEYYSIYK